METFYSTKHQCNEAKNLSEDPQEASNTEIYCETIFKDHTQVGVAYEFHEIIR